MDLKEREKWTSLLSMVLVKSSGDRNLFAGAAEGGKDLQREQRGRALGHEVVVGVELLGEKPGGISRGVGHGMIEHDFLPEKFAVLLFFVVGNVNPRFALVADHRGFWNDDAAERFAAGREDGGNRSARTELIL